MKEEKEVMIKYSVECPECKKKIKGNSPDHVHYNLKIHMDAKHGNL